MLMVILYGCLRSRRRDKIDQYIQITDMEQNEEIWHTLSWLIRGKKRTALQCGSLVICETLTKKIFTCSDLTANPKSH